jgi:hypothetical protein
VFSWPAAYVEQEVALAVVADGGDVALGLGQRHLYDAIVHKHLHACMYKWRSPIEKLIKEEHAETLAQR